MSQATEPAGRVRVLFVEDNPDDVELELTILRQGGFAVDYRVIETASDLSDALQHDSWDIVICDYRMPELSGIEALKIAKALAPGTPFILVSGTVGEDLAVEAMRSGADDYALKENLTRLASAVQREVRGAQSRKAGALSEKGLRLLAELGARIGKSLDRLTVVREVPALLVRELGGLCCVDIVEQDGRSSRAAWAVSDPAMGALLEQLSSAYPPQGVTPTRLERPQHLHVAIAIENLDDANAARIDPAFVEIAKQLALRAAVTVPMVAENRLVGAINLGRWVPYSTVEVRIIEELASRVAVAIENASLYEQAQRAIRVRDEFLSIASHELRTPITALQLQIQGLNDLARKKQAEWNDERLLKRLERSARSVERLGQLVEGLLDVSRISAGTLRLAPDEVDLVAIARELLERFKEQAERADCAMTFRAPDSLIGRWDRVRLEQVVSNLLSNAIKYGADHPIELEVVDAGQHAVIRVVDHGIGIPPSDLDRIFGRFERAVSSRHYGGLGLGLFIVRRIVESHGGAITAEPTSGGGATFVVTLPKELVSDQPDSAVVAPGSSLSGRALGVPMASALAPGEAFALVREVKDYAIYMIDREGKILTWNEGARAIKGYTAEEIIGKDFALFFTEEEREQGRPEILLVHAAAEGRAEERAWRVRKNGGRFWADVVITAVHDEEGRLRGFMKVTRDLSEQRRAEEHLRHTEDHLRLLIESLEDYAIFMLDGQGRVTTWNRGAERVTGYRTEEVLGRNFSFLYVSEDVAAEHPRRDMDFALRQGRFEEEGWRLRKDGRRFRADNLLAAIRDPHTGVLRGFANVTRDRSATRSLDEAAPVEAG